MKNQDFSAQASLQPVTVAELIKEVLANAPVQCHVNTVARRALFRRSEDQGCYNLTLLIMLTQIESVAVPVTMCRSYCGKL